MATITQIYPHVNVSTRALLRRYVEPTDTGATTLFAPFYSKQGPANEIIKIYNLSQFIDKYGEPDLTYQGRTILNIYNWLTAGGAVYAMRLVSPNATIAEKKFTAGITDDIDYITITAKYAGAFYNDISIHLVGVTTSLTKYLNAEILLDGKIIQTVYKLTEDNISDVLSTTEYIGSFEFGTFEDEKTFDDLVTLIGTSGISIQLAGGEDDEKFSFEDSLGRFLGVKPTTTLATSTAPVAELLEYSFRVTSFDSIRWAKGDTITATSGIKTIVGTITEFTITDANPDTYYDITVDTVSTANIDDNVTSWVLSLTTLNSEHIYTNYVMNKLAIPFDVILDAGYPETIKEGLKDLANDRDDAFLFLDMYDFSTDPSILRGTLTDIVVEKINQALYTQRYLINEVISGKNIWVTPGYFLASLLPYNDAIYGLQWPTAGLTRGILSGVKDIDENPNADRKTFFFSKKINYSEKDSRGVRLMSQRTGEANDTALQFINNVRTLNRITRDLEWLGKEYLFEFNDLTTLLNMQNALKRYITGWIQNRTLAYGEVEVSKNPYSDERVDVKLNIKFTGTIEIISIEITIE